MRRLFPCAASLVVLLLLHVREGQTTCSREYSREEPDCTTATLEGGQDASSKLSCFLKTEGEGSGGDAGPILQNLEIPDKK